jgi:hypothetical protein
VKELVCTFKIGDIVQAKTYNHFAVTDRGKPCRVVDIKGAKIELKCLWNGNTFWESWVAFEKMYPEDILHSGDIVGFVQDYYIEFTTIPKGTKVVFQKYYTYGVMVFYNGGIIKVPMEYIRKYHKGMLI